MTKGKSRTKPPTHARSLEDLAAALGLSRRYVIELRRRGMPPAKTSQGYEVDAARKWYEENITTRERPDDEVQSLRDKLTRVQIQKRSLERDKLRMEVRLRKGELLEREDVEEQRQREVSFVKQNLFALARPLSRKGARKPAKDLERILAQGFRELMESFSKL